MRLYELAGASHLRKQDLIVAGIEDPETANPEDWYPMVRAIFSAVTTGRPLPPSIWLGARNDNTIARDSGGNALVRFVGGHPVVTQGLRMPEVAVGLGQYIAVDTRFQNTDLLRAIGGSFVSHADQFKGHRQYVSAIVGRVKDLSSRGYLLPADATAIISRAEATLVGPKPLAVPAASA
jgi:hypothetical protein